MPPPARHSWWIVFTCLTAGICLSGCTSDGHLNLFGYTTVPNYDTTIRTVYVPVFANTTFRRGIEFELHRAVIREIEAKTPYKVTDSPVGADTELMGRVVNHRKGVINTNQLGEVREAEISIGVEVVWRDLRPGHGGELLSNPARKDALPPGVPELPKGGPVPGTVLIAPVAGFIPELGGSIASAEKRIADQLAVQIVSMMEIWKQTCR